MGRKHFSQWLYGSSREGFCLGNSLLSQFISSGGVGDGGGLTVIKGEALGTKVMG